MYKVTYEGCRPSFYANLTDLTSALKNDFSDGFVNKVEEAMKSCDHYHYKFFSVEHYVGYIYDGNSFTSLWGLAQTLAAEVDRDTKIEWFIQNVGICARMDNGDEIELPWYDMIYDDYDHEAYDNSLSSEIDYHTAKEINKALEALAPESGSFVLSFWDSSFNIEVEED